MKDIISLNKPASWLVTGCAGFIGSHITEYLLLNGQEVIGLDNLSTGNLHNLSMVQTSTKERFSNFRFIEGDLTNLELCIEITKNIDFVLHQAALGSVPRSLEDPLRSHNSNINGFLNILFASNQNNVKKFIYAASSSTYGDSKELPKQEERIGDPLSPYAVTKYVNELYAKVFQRSYGIETIGLRYFNVFGERQDSNSAYAAVIPKWIDAIFTDEPIYINGDGSTSRDFTYVQNVVLANILASNASTETTGQVYNVACGKQYSLIYLFKKIVEYSSDLGVEYNHDPIFRDFRSGDVLHSLADINKISNYLRYEPLVYFDEGLKNTILWKASLLNESS